MTSSEDFPCTSTWDINGGRSNNKTRWRSHLGMILRCTGRSSRKALTSSLMYGSAAGSYTQWRCTEATCDVKLTSMEVVHPWRGASCRCWNDDFWLETLFILQNATNLDQWDSYTCCEDSRRHLDIMLAASLERPFALRMAWRVSTRSEVTFSVTPSPVQTSCVSRSWPSTNSGIGSSWDRSINSGNHDAAGSVERSNSPPLLVTERSSAVLAGPSWMTGTRTRRSLP